MAAVHDKMDATSDANVVYNEMSVQQTQNIIQNENMTTGQLRKTNDSGTQQLDKFKRRLIRAVARLRKKKTSEAEMWQELEKEIGCDCRMLWQHMRTLTLKKLRRLLPANDMLEAITRVARFSATDWLLFDLVLVHDNVDVITAVDHEKTDAAHGKRETDKFKEPECLYELFELVKQYNMEGLVGAELTEAWIRITLKYNSRGRQVSPMLLQLRWYQMKELCRASFYNFWYSYRGNAKYLPIAMAAKPTKLQAAIVKEFTTIIIQSYTPWETRIQERRVILSEEFARGWEIKRKVEEEREEKENEVELIEPQVETIDLDEDDSDTNGATTLETRTDDDDGNDNEQSASHKECSEITNCIKSIKTEVDDGLEIDGLAELEAMHIPIEASNAYENTEYSNDHSGDISTVDTEISHDITLPTITSVVGNAVEANKYNSDDELNSILEDTARNMKQKLMPKITENENNANKMSDSDDEIEDILREKASSLMNIEITQIKTESNVEQNADVSKENVDNLDTSKELCNSEKNVLSGSNESLLCDSDDEINRMLQEKAEQFMCIEDRESKTKANEQINLTHESSFVNVTNDGSVTDKSNTSLKEELGIEKGKVTEDDISDEKNVEGLEEIDFDDDGIEFEDDGIEFVDDDEQNEDKNINIKLETDSLDDTSDTDKNENGDEPKIDLKLLMDPKVYTKKLDQMEVFKFTDYYFVNDKRVIDCAFLESKPVDKCALKEEDIEKFRDQAVLGDKSDDIRNDDSDDQFSDHDILDYKSNDMQKQDNGEETTNNKESNNKVKITSWLLQKPKKRNYNPIKLCKNPDFNTRLKRLTAGFMSLSSNRTLLKECKPLTIDLHKAFERKLENNTLYLEGGDFKSAHAVSINIKQEKQETIITSTIPCQSNVNESNRIENISTQIPGPVQCFDESKDSSQLLSKVQDSLPSERRKVIHLPDIDQVRRVNQSLLTAEVTPVSIGNKTYSRNPNIAMAIVPPLSKESVEGAMGTLSTVPVTPIEDKKLEINQTFSGQNKSNTDLIAHKINNQIIDISNQISLFDSNEYDKDRKNNKIKTNAKSNKLKKILCKKVQKKNIKYAKPFQTKPAPVKDEISWMAKYVGNYFADSLLTMDTLNKILYLVTNEEEDKKSVEPKTSQSLKTDPKAKKAPNKSDATASKCINPDVKTDNYNSKLSNEATELQKQSKQKVSRSRKQEPRKYTGIFCCWAREKISFLNIKRPLKGHDCPKFKCQCCCRHELNVMKLAQHTRKNNKKSTTTIVLSDDEECDPKNIYENSSVCKNSTESTKNYDENTNVGLQTTNTPNTSVTTNTNVKTIAIATVKGHVTTNTIVTTNTSVTTNTNVTFTVTAGSGSNVVENNVKLNTVTDRVNQIPVIIPKIVEKTNFETQLPIRPSILQKKNNTTINRCKTVVIPAKGHPYNDRVHQLSTAIPAEIVEQSGKDHLSQSITEEKSVTKNIGLLWSAEKTKRSRINLAIKRPKAPIFIGKNKVLLCALKKATLDQSPLPLPTLPNGVSFMLLPNGELTLSIAPGVELCTDMLRALPSVMTVVQDQIKKYQLATSSGQNCQQDTLPLHASTTTVPFSVNTIDPAKENSLMSINPQTIDMNAHNPAIEISIHPSEGSKNISINVSSDLKNSEKASTCTSKETEKLNIETDCEPTQPELNTDAVLERKSEEIQSTPECQVDSSLLTESSLPPTKHSTNDVNLEDKNDADSAPINSRKSLLSDLMEMSGISAEDTSLLSDKDENASYVPLPPYIIPVTKPQINEANVSVLSPATTHVPDNITIAGPQSNLLLFPPTTAVNYLLNCIGEIRPELNAVTSFAELKYACENNGKFYKLDTETGSILPINVVVKKNLKVKPSPATSDVIDLTDDNDITSSEVHTDDGTTSTKNNETQINYSFEFLTQSIANKKSVVKPLKLFKAVHRSVLKQGGKSIIKIVAPKKLVTKIQPQKCDLGDTSNIVSIDLDNESNSSTLETDVPVPPLRSFDNSYDSSDDEPLAKKSKRLKLSEKNDDVAKEALQPVDDEMIEEEVASVPEIVDNDDTGNASDGEVNNMDIQGVNPELHPIVFEEGSDSEDDMCILGV